MRAVVNGEVGPRGGNRSIGENVKLEIGYAPAVKLKDHMKGLRNGLQRLAEEESDPVPPFGWAGHDEVGTSHCTVLVYDGEGPPQSGVCWRTAKVNGNPKGPLGPAGVRGGGLLPQEGAYRNPPEESPHSYGHRDHNEFCGKGRPRRTSTWCGHWNLNRFLE